MVNSKQVLIYTDFSDSSGKSIKCGLEWTFKLSAHAILFHIPKLNSITKHFNFDAESEVIANKFSEIYTSSIQEKLIEEKKKYLRRDIPISTKIVDDNGVESFNNYVSKNKVSLLVLPILFKSYDKIFFNDSIERIIRTSKVPVLVVQNAETIKPKNVLFPFDFDAESIKTLSLLDSLSNKFNISVTPVHITSEDSLENLKLSSTEEKFRSEIFNIFENLKNCNEIEIINTDGKSVKEALGLYISSTPCDLVVMGSSTKSTLERLTLGSVAEYILRNCKKSLLISK
jgi:nucleotide-binding universal stress UspA family protein